MSNPTVPPTAPPPDKPNLPAKVVSLLTPGGFRALRQGDRDGLVRESLPAGVDLAQITPDVRTGLDRLATVALELRRSSVAVLGSHEAFVRMTPDGASLYQVIQPVKLSVAEKTLYQMTVNRPYFKGTDDLVPFKELDALEPKKVQWKQVPKPGEEHSAKLTYEGYVKVNSVAGCAVVQPPFVVVDGEKKTNPFVHRTIQANGRLGDIQRIVIGVTCVGAAPATGNPVACNYILDYDPTKELQFMLADLAKMHPDHCFLVDENDFVPKPGWKFTPLFGGVGYYYDLRLKETQGAYADFTNVLQNAMKKASTVAKRNCMRSHPALGVQSVVTDEMGRATIAVVGWAGGAVALGQWNAIMIALARGGDLPDRVDVIDGGSDRYEPENEEDPGARRPNPIDVESTTSLDPEIARRNALISQIDDGMKILGPDQVAKLDYRPEAQNEAELRAVLKRLNTIADEGGS